MTHAECLAALSAKFDTLLTKLQTAIFRRSSLHVNANGTYTADDHEGYGTVVVDVPPVTVQPRLDLLQVYRNSIYSIYDTEYDGLDGWDAVFVRVPDIITFERFTGRYSKNTKNLGANLTWEATVSNAVMDVDTLPRTDDMHQTAFLAVFYCKSTIAQPFTAIRCKMECSMMIGDTADHVETWDVPFKMEHTSVALADGKYAYMAQFGLRLSAIYPDGVPAQYTAIRLDKIYTEVCTGSVAQQLDAGAVTTITALANV